MDKTVRGGKAKVLSGQTEKYKERYFKKLRAYATYVQLGLIAQGVMQYLALYHTRLVWGNFGSWLRTIRKNVLPTEIVVGMVLRHCLLDFSRVTLSLQNCRNSSKKRQI